MLWALCLTVSVVSKGTGVYLITPLLKHIECQRTDLQSFFSVEPSDNLNILTKLYYHDRSTVIEGSIRNS